MNSIKENAGLVALVILAIMGVAAFVPKDAILGSTSCQETTCLTGGLRILDGVLESDGSFQIGSSGSSMTKIIEGTGILIMPSYVSLAASTTLAADIAVSGVVSGDQVFAQFATSTANGAGWLVTGASASSTSGYVTLRIVNNTGAAATIPASIASSTNYLVIK